MSLLLAEELAVRPRGAPADPVIRGFSLRLDAGQWVAVTGPNGGGKTTLALALAGLLPIAAGRLELAGRPLGSARRNIGVVLQEPADQLLQETVRAELGFAARNLGLEEAAIEPRVSRWSARLGLDPLLERDPRTLSAGEQQRVLLGAAMVADPALLVADEGGAHLDPAFRGEWLRILRAEVGRGLAVVWVSQEPAELGAADRVIRIESPRAVEGGSVATPVSTPAPDEGSLDFPSTSVARVEVTIAPPPARVHSRIDCGTTLRIQIQPAAIVSVTGRNGAGKSVLLAAIAGIEPHPQVSCRWGAVPEPGPLLVGQYPEREIFSETVAAEIAFAAVARGRERRAVLDQAARLLERLELPGKMFLGRRTWELSSGEKRLVQIVAGLLAPAPLLLLDEPTCGLDPSRSERLAGEIARRLTQSPVVLATQDRIWAEGFGGPFVELVPVSRAGMPSPSKKTD